MKKSHIFSLLFILTFLCISFAYAQAGREKRQGMMHERGDHRYGAEYSDTGRHESRHMHGDCFSYSGVMDELDLSDDQAEKLRAKKSQFRKEKIKLRASLKVAEIEFGELLSEETVNMEAVEDKIREIADLKAKFMMNAAKASAEMRSILSSEQREKVRKIIREKRDECRMFGGSGMHEGPCMMMGPRWSDD